MMVSALNINDNANMDALNFDIVKFDFSYCLC